LVSPLIDLSLISRKCETVTICAEQIVGFHTFG
jgi:hypothetical protein